MESALERLSPSFKWHTPHTHPPLLSAGGAWKAAKRLGEICPCRGSNLKVPGRGGKPEVTSPCSQADNRLLNNTVGQFCCFYQWNGFACQWWVLFQGSDLSLNHCLSKTGGDYRLALSAVLTDPALGSLPLPVTGMCQSCLPMMGRFAAGTETKPRC